MGEDGIESRQGRYRTPLMRKPTFDMRCSLQAMPRAAILVTASARGWTGLSLRIVRFPKATGDEFNPIYLAEISVLFSVTYRQFLP